MFKVALLGIENSHANAFVEFVQEGLYPEVEIVGAYSPDKEALDYFTDKYKIAKMPSYDSLVGKIDGVMITSRHGKYHFEFAKPYMESGIPMFIDKPITVSIEDAEEMVKLAKKHGVRFCGGSTCGFVKEVQEIGAIVKNQEIGKCIGGSVIVPLCYKEEYGGFFFYAQHLVQVMLNVFGFGVKEVLASKDENNGYTATFKYDDFVVNGIFSETGFTNMYYFHVTAYGKDKVESRLFDVEKSDFKHEMNDMLALLKGQAQKQTYEDFIFPVYVMNAVEESAKTNKWVKVK